jgi:hypothetical protein
MRHTRERSGLDDRFRMLVAPFSVSYTFVYDLLDKMLNNSTTRQYINENAILLLETTTVEYRLCVRNHFN